MNLRNDYYVTIKSITPLLMHRGGLADPLDDWARRIKEVTGKKNKTEADYQELKRLEWHGSIYADDQGRPCIPGQNIENMLGQAAAKLRLKTVSRSALFCDGDFPLIYKGPKAYDDLWGDPEFVDSRLESVNRNKVVRTRPIFRDWSLEFGVSIETDQLNESQLQQILEIGGRCISLGDRRPKFGRFEVVSFERA